MPPRDEELRKPRSEQRASNDNRQDLAEKDRRSQVVGSRQANSPAPRSTGPATRRRSRVGGDRYPGPPDCESCAHLTGLSTVRCHRDSRLKYRECISGLFLNPGMNPDFAVVRNSRPRPSPAEGECVVLRAAIDDNSTTRNPERGVAATSGGSDIARDNDRAASFPSLLLIHETAPP